MRIDSSNSIAVRIKGKETQVPCVSVFGRVVFTRGKWLKIAAVNDELYHETIAVEDPEAFISDLKDKALAADIFTFSQVLPDTSPKYEYLMEWDNLAVTPTNFREWWENRLPQEGRKNVRRAAKRGVDVKLVKLDDELIKGIHEIFNEVPIRQGTRFWHYGKDIGTVKKEISTFLNRSDFLAAYFEGELIGFIKLVYAGNSAGIMAILSKEKHYDKRPTNALIAKAVEVCDQKRIPFLVYGKYIYGKKEQSPLADFKRRNGFEMVLIPRYFIPLTSKGRLALKLGLHHGLRGMLPSGLVIRLVEMRASFLRVQLLLTAYLSTISDGVVRKIKPRAPRCGTTNSGILPTEVGITNANREASEPSANLATGEKPLV